MANDSGIIYIDTSTTPDEGVCIADLQDVLNTSRNDLGAIITTCGANGTIKKWAKYKPYRAQNVAVSHSARVASNYGLDIQVFDSLGSPSTANSFLAKLVAGELAWEYLYPRGKGNGYGGSNEWFRIKDFVAEDQYNAVVSGHGYNHNAECPVGDVVTDVPVNIYGNASVNWEVMDVSGIQDNLTLTDIIVSGNPISEYYLGLFMTKGAMSETITSTTKIGYAGQTNSLVIELTNATSYAGTWRCYPFLSSVQIAQGGSGTTGVYFSAGWDAPYADITFRLQSQYLSFYAYGLWNVAHNSISIEWEAFNENSTTYTVTPEIHLYKTTGQDFDASAQLEATLSLGSMTIPAKSGGTAGHASGTATMNYNGYDDDYIWWLKVTAGTFDNTAIQIEEPDGPRGE